jgi:hypothetical protein
MHNPSAPDFVQEGARPAAASVTARSIPGDSHRPDAIMPERIRFATLLAFVLIAVGALRVHAVVGAAPMLGYANQFDMGRTSACIGLWPDIPMEARLRAHPEAPIATYVRDERHPQDCYWSSELLFVAPVAALMGVGDKLDLRVVGAVKGVALVAIALAFGAMLRNRPGLALAHAVVFALVVCDPIVTLWMNTLYTEFSALFFAYASVVLTVAIGARPVSSAPPPRSQVIALALSLAGLGLSRQQHMWLPALLALPLVFSLWSPARRSALVLVAVAAAVAALQAGHLSAQSAIVRANSVDVVLGAVLPASTNQALTASRLGLPERCLRSVGASWYVTMGESLQSTCPEAFETPRSRVVALLATEPSTLWRAALRAVPQLQGWRLGYMGSVEGQSFGGGKAARDVGGALAVSIAPFVAGIPLTVFMQMLAAAGALLLASGAACVAAAVSRRSAPLAWSLYALTAVAWYAIVSSIFGDGYVELPRHAHLASVAFYAALVLLIVSLLAPLLAMMGGGRERATNSAVRFALLAIAIAALSLVPLRYAMDTTPMAFGVVAEPAENKVPPGDVEFSGWAVDPRGVERVDVVVDGDAAGSTVISARVGMPYTGARGDSLTLYFPVYPRADAAGFSAKIPAQMLAHGGAEVRTFAVNWAGGRTEIDRRRLITEAR